MCHDWGCKGLGRWFTCYAKGEFKGRWRIKQYWQVACPAPQETVYIVYVYIHIYIYIHIQVCVYIYIHSSGSHGATDHAPLAHPRSIHLFGPYQRELPHCACSTILCFRFNGYLLSGNKAEPTQWHIDWRKLLKPAYPTFTGLFDFNPRPFCDFCTYQFRAWQGDPFCFLTLLRTSWASQVSLDSWLPKSGCVFGAQAKMQRFLRRREECKMIQAWWKIMSTYLDIIKESWEAIFRVTDK